MQVEVRTGGEGRRKEAKSSNERQVVNRVERRQRGEGEGHKRKRERETSGKRQAC